MNWLRDLLFNNKISSETVAVNDELDSHYVLRTNRAKKNINGSENLEVSIPSTESESDDLVPETKRAKSINSNSTKSHFTIDYLKLIISNINQNDMLLVKKKCREDMAESLNIKLSEYRTIYKYKEEAINDERIDYPSLISILRRNYTDGRPSFITENVKLELAKSINLFPKGVTDAELGKAVQRGHLLDCSFGNAITSKTTKNKFSSTQDYSKLSKKQLKIVKLELQNKERYGNLTTTTASNKYKKRGIKLDEIYGHIAAAAMYVTTTFENPKLVDGIVQLGNRRVSEYMTFNVDDMSILFGNNNSNKKLQVIVKKDTKKWMDETRLQGVINDTSSNKLTNYSQSFKPIVSEGGRLIGIVIYHKCNLATADISIHCLRAEVANHAVYYAIVGTSCTQTKFEEEVYMKILIPVIIAERKRLIEGYIRGKLVSNGLLINDELDRINNPNIDSMIEEYRQEAMIKYKIANIFTDGAFGLINALQQDTLQAAAREFDITFCKWSAQHSLCQNALDSSVCFSITHSIFETVKNDQSSYSITPPDWFPSFCTLIDRIYPSSSARKDAIKVVQSYMGEVRDKAYQGTTISKGWIANGMGVDAYSDLFDFKVFLSHWTCWRNLNEQEIIDLELAFWTKIVPSARNNNYTIDMLTIHNAVKDIVEYEELTDENNRTLKCVNQQLAMVMCTDNFTKYAADKLKLNERIRLKNDENKRLLKIAADEKKERQLVIDNLFVINITEEKDADIATINNLKSEKLQEINESYNNAVNGLKVTHGINRLNLNAKDKLQLKSCLGPLKENKDLAIKLCNEMYKRDINNRNERYKSDRKRLINSRNESMNQLGGIIDDNVEDDETMGINMNDN